MSRATESGSQKYPTAARRPHTISHQSTSTARPCPRSLPVKLCASTAITHHQRHTRQGHKRTHKPFKLRLPEVLPPSFSSSPGQPPGALPLPTPRPTKNDVHRPRLASDTPAGAAQRAVGRGRGGGGRSVARQRAAGGVRDVFARAQLSGRVARRAHGRLRRTLLLAELQVERCAGRRRAAQEAPEGRQRACARSTVADKGRHGRW
jgi:hypothetical protein